MAFHLNGYSNFHDDNQDWIISKIKSIDDAEANAAESATEAAASASAAAESATNAAASALESANSAATLAGKAEQVDLNTERIDNILVTGTPTEGNAELIDIRAGANGVTYATAGDAVRGQFRTNENAIRDIDEYIPMYWNIGAINRDSGAVTVADNRIYTSFVSTSSRYLTAHTQKSGALIIEIFRYNLDETYVDYQYAVIKNDTIIGYSFDVNHKYRFVSREVDYPFLITEKNETDYILSVGSIGSNGVYNPYSTNTAIYKFIETPENNVVVCQHPGCNIDLFVYDANENYVKTLTSRDTANNTIYFPIIPGFKYRVYFGTENADECHVSVLNETPRTVYTGGVYNGIPIVSTGNNRTALINVTNYKYIYISASVTCVVTKFRNNETAGTASAYCGIFSPAVINVSDCDFVYVLSNGLSNITYSLDNTNRLQGLKWCSYGDSITEQQRWQNYLVARYGLVLSNKGLGGSCVTGQTASSVTPMTDSARINTIDTDTNIITVMGGTNDFDYCTNIGSVDDLQTSYDESTFIGSVASIVKKLQARCPNAKIILMSNPNTRGVTGQTSEKQQTSTYGYTPYDFAVAMKSAAEWLSVDYIDVWSCGINQLNRTAYVDDSVHPNIAGGKLIADKVMQHFNTML